MIGTIVIPVEGIWDCAVEGGRGLGMGRVRWRVKGRGGAGLEAGVFEFLAADDRGWWTLFVC